jgi:hypothetical protein
MPNDDMPGTYVVDKSQWPRGPWDDEPDRIEFRHAGLPCLMARHPRWGNWCGYAAVPPGHPLHGRGWRDLDAADLLDANVNYSAGCGGLICHVPAAGEPDDVWWFGCDFGHAFDFQPGMDAELPPEMRGAISEMQTYRDQLYVRHVVERMAEQLAGVTA